jgi:hypothetical protein
MGLGIHHMSMHNFYWYGFCIRLFFYCRYQGYYLLITTFWDRFLALMGVIGAIAASVVACLVGFTCSERFYVGTPTASFQCTGQIPISAWDTEPCQTALQDVP